MTELNHAGYAVFHRIFATSSTELRDLDIPTIMSNLRVGMGHDIHRLESGRKLVLGGVPIESELGLMGHSDADIVLHATIDALLGAAGLGDIGDAFPDTDAAYKGIDSTQLLKRTMQRLKEHNWTIENLDCTIHAQRPKLAEHKQTIRNRVAELLELELEAVNIKAKTGESVGPVGRGGSDGRRLCRSDRSKRLNKLMNQPRTIRRELSHQTARLVLNLTGIRFQIFYHHVQL